MILILLPLIFISCDKFKSKDNSGLKKIVNAQGGLRMRETSDTSGKVISIIPDKSEVSVIETTGSEIEISGKKGKWTKVSFENKEGWIFGGFLIQNIASSGKTSIPIEVYSKHYISSHGLNSELGENDIGVLTISENQVQILACKGGGLHKIVGMDPMSGGFLIKFAPSQSEHNPGPTSMEISINLESVKINYPNFQHTYLFIKDNALKEKLHSYRQLFNSRGWGDCDNFLKKENDFSYKGE